MHELSLMRNVVRTVLMAAEKNSSNKVEAVTLLVGESRAFEENWAQMYFDMFAKDTLADGAKVNLEQVPITGNCINCGEVYRIDLHNKKCCCPKCGTSEYNLITGREMIVKSIEICQ